MVRGLSVGWTVVGDVDHPGTSLGGSVGKKNREGVVLSAGGNFRFVEGGHILAVVVVGVERVRGSHWCCGLKITRKTFVN